MKTRIEPFEPEVIWIGAVEMVQLVKFLLHKREGPELSYLVPTLKERKKMGMDKWREGGEGWRDGWSEKGRKGRREAGQARNAAVPL